MPSSKFVVESKITESFRTKKVKGLFDIEMDYVRKEFDVNIPIEDQKWNVGLIVGSSGSGKTTIAKHVFKGFKIFDKFDWTDRAIVDDFEKSLSAKKITEALSKVGFSSPPDWLKPFHVLSNGQKMRAELARLILEFDEPVIYDEFTSFVDRQVAKIGSAAISKFIKKEDKRFIAISCHDDIEQWLEPDWVYNVDNHSFKRRLERRPKIKIDIRKAINSEWGLFKEFHYLSAAHHNSAHKYIAEINNKIVGWCSVLHFPHPIVKKMKRLHRVVIRPDYQGIGIGFSLICQIAQMYKDKGFRVTIVLSTPALIHAMIKSTEWIMIRKPSRTSKSKLTSSSFERLTASFEYKPSKVKK